MRTAARIITGCVRSTTTHAHNAINYNAGGPRSGSGKDNAGGTTHGEGAEGALPVAALGGPGLEVVDLDWTGRS